MDNQSYGRGSGIKDFMNSSSLVARFAFILLVIILFVIVLRMSVSILKWFLTPNGSPKIIDGMIDGRQMIVVPQNPNSEGAFTVARSVNGPAGIEFTWCIWVFIDDTQSNTFRHIFHKGNYGIDPNSGLNSPNNAPGLYIAPGKNALTIIMNTYNNITEDTTIENIPLNKWVNVVIRCRNINLDVYINGTITKSVELSGVPRQNYGDIYIAANGGFSGFISNLWYFDYGLGVSAINNIVKAGPNTKLANSSNALYKNIPDYLSVRWYFAGTGDQFNPYESNY